MYSLILTRGLVLVTLVCLVLNLGVGISKADDEQTGLLQHWLKKLQRTQNTFNDGEAQDFHVGSIAKRSSETLDPVPTLDPIPDTDMMFQDQEPVCLVTYEWEAYDEAVNYQGELVQIYQGVARWEKQWFLNRTCNFTVLAEEHLSNNETCRDCCYFHGARETSPLAKCHQEVELQAALVVVNGTSRGIFSTILRGQQLELDIDYIKINTGCTCQVDVWY